MLKAFGDRGSRERSWERWRKCGNGTSGWFLVNKNLTKPKDFSSRNKKLGVESVSTHLSFSSSPSMNRTLVSMRTDAAAPSGQRHFSAAHVDASSSSHHDIPGKYDVIPNNRLFSETGSDVFLRSFY